MSDHTKSNLTRKNVRSRQVTGQRMTSLGPPKLGRILSRSSDNLPEVMSEERGVRGMTSGTSSSASNLLHKKHKLPPVTVAASESRGVCMCARMSKCMCVVCEWLCPGLRA